MEIESSLGAVQFKIELTPIATDKAVALRDKLAGLHLLYHNVGSKNRPETYSDKSVESLEKTMAEVFADTFEIKMLEHSEYVKLEYATLRKSLAGMSEEYIAGVIADRKAFDEAKKASKTAAPTAQPTKLAVA